MPWVSLGTASCAPGESRVFTGLAVERQPYIVVFPEYSERTVRYFGVWRWIFRESAPANAIAVSRYDKVVWHNGERISVTANGFGGEVRFYVPESFPTELLIQMFRFE